MRNEMTGREMKLISIMTSVMLIMASTFRWVESVPSFCLPGWGAIPHIQARFDLCLILPQCNLIPTFPLLEVVDYKILTTLHRWSWSFSHRPSSFPSHMEDPGPLGASFTISVWPTAVRSFSFRLICWSVIPSFSFTFRCSLFATFVDRCLFTLFCTIRAVTFIFAPSPDSPVGPGSTFTVLFLVGSHGLHVLTGYTLCTTWVWFLHLDSLVPHGSYLHVPLSWVWFLTAPAGSPSYTTFHPRWSPPFRFRSLPHTRAISALTVVVPLVDFVPFHVVLRFAISFTTYRSHVRSVVRCHFTFVPRRSWAVPYVRLILPFVPHRSLSTSRPFRLPHHLPRSYFVRSLPHHVHVHSSLTHDLICYVHSFDDLLSWPGIIHCIVIVSIDVICCWR